LGYASTSLQVLGRTYTSQGYVCDEGHGFGPGVCVPGYDFIEIVVPSWAATSDAPALPNGWVPFVIGYFPGLWWAGDLTSVQPAFISTQFPEFRIPGQTPPQHFTAALQAVDPLPDAPVPEPSTLILMGTILSGAAARRALKRRVG